MITTVLLVLLLASTLHFAIRLEYLRAEAREDLITAYNAIAGLHEVAKEAHSISQFEHRTAASMSGGTPWSKERHPAVAAAKARGFEVWRNEQVGPMQGRLRAGYRKYETNTRRLVQRVQDLT